MSHSISQKLPYVRAKQGNFLDKERDMDLVLANV